jgi:hypothetical protein
MNNRKKKQTISFVFKETEMNNKKRKTVSSPSVPMKKKDELKHAIEQEDARNIQASKINQAIHDALTPENIRLSILKEELTVNDDGEETEEEEEEEEEDEKRVYLMNCGDDSFILNNEIDLNQSFKKFIFRLLKKIDKCDIEKGNQYKNYNLYVSTAKGLSVDLAWLITVILNPSKPMQEGAKAYNHKQIRVAFESWFETQTKPLKYRKMNTFIKNMGTDISEFLYGKSSQTFVSVKIINKV